MSELISRELLEHATDDELDAYVRWLADEADTADIEAGDWVLQERQQVAEDALSDLAPDMSHELLYGGTAGPGKTEFLLWHAYHQAKKYPGLRVLGLRRSFRELRRSFVLRSLERFDRSEATYVITENTWKFKNGSTIEFGYCETDNDVYQYQSAEYDIVFWDELTQWPSDFCYLYLFSRVRSRISMLARGFVPHILAATNPGYVGGAWVKARFVDIAEWGTRAVIELDVEGMFGTRIFIPGVLSDNKYINRKQYVAGLSNLPKRQREALLEGRWDVIEGQYFEEWDANIHVCRPFEVPVWWTRLRCVDYGHFAPFCCLWIAFDQDGDAIVYREAYETTLTPRMQCELILKSQKPGERIAYTVIDPSTFAKTGVGVPIAQQYMDAGVPVRRALNARIDGWARVREFLQARPAPNPLDPPRAGLRVFSTCTNLLRTLPMLVHDIAKPEDLDSDGEDHAADALRYGLMSRPPRGRRPTAEPTTLEGRMAKSRRERDRERMGLKGVDHPQLGRI